MEMLRATGIEFFAVPSLDRRAPAASFAERETAWEAVKTRRVAPLTGRLQEAELVNRPLARGARPCRGAHGEILLRLSSRVHSNCHAA
jgi:hypothetical protein